MYYIVSIGRASVFVKPCWISQITVLLTSDEASSVNRFSVYVVICQWLITSILSSNIIVR